MADGFPRKQDKRSPAILDNQQSKFESLRRMLVACRIVQ